MYELLYNFVYVSENEISFKRNKKHKETNTEKIIVQKGN